MAPSARSPASKSPKRAASDQSMTMSFSERTALRAGIQGSMRIAPEGRAWTVRPRNCKRGLKGCWLRLALFGIALAMLTSSQRAMAQPNARTEEDVNSHSEICHMIEVAARSNGLPVDFFTRVIWQESRLQPDVIGPPTTGGRAEGIAQFMPGTAAERGLYEPFNPAEALPKSGEFLAELRNEFGNLGLAAAAYNAGPQRVRDYLSGARGLPRETRNYVLAITGHPIEEWAISAITSADAGGKSPGENPALANCKDLLAALARTSNRYNSQWAGRTFPSWCKALRHPDVSSCGPVHLQTFALNTPSIIFLRGHEHLLRSRSVRTVRSSVR
jgi:Transglycosylase SLT domain